jgi:hypothetical protein
MNIFFYPALVKNSRPGSIIRRYGSRFSVTDRFTQPGQGLFLTSTKVTQVLK